MKFSPEVDQEISLHIKDSSSRQYLTTSSRHCCTIAEYSHSSPEILSLSSRVHHRVAVENISKKFNCGMKIVDLERISADFLSYTLLDKRFF